MNAPYQSSGVGAETFSRKLTGGPKGVNTQMKEIGEGVVCYTCRS